MAEWNFLEVELKASPFFGLVNPELTDPKKVDDAISPQYKDILKVEASNCKSVLPNKGFCVKAKTDKNEKLFINVCHTPDIEPPPSSLNVHQIIAGEKANEVSLFPFPLSLGELHLEKDKSGNDCKCYDVVLNSDYYNEVSKDTVLRDFIMTLACSGLERKYDISIDVGTCLVLNKPYHGKMPLHFIRLKPIPKTGFSPVENIVADQDIIMPVKNPCRLKVLQTPEISNSKLYEIPDADIPSLLVFQGLATAVEDKKSLLVLVSKRKLTVRHISGKILSNVILPYDVIPDKSMSNFWKNRLTVALFVEEINS